MRPMRNFDPDRPAIVHDLVNDRTFVWHTGDASAWRECAVTDRVDGTVWFDGLVLDGWEPAARHS